MIFIANFLLSVTVKEFLKNDPTLLKYPPEYTAYFFEPPFTSIDTNMGEILKQTAKPHAERGLQLVIKVDRPCS